MNQHKACEAVLKIINFERQTCDRQTETCQLTERGRIYNGLNCTVDDDQGKLGKFWGGDSSIFWGIAGTIPPKNLKFRVGDKDSIFGEFGHPN